MDVTIWHNPRCSKSRQTLALLQERGLNVTERLYLDNAPTKAELIRALQMLGKRPSELVRKGEALFKELSLNNADETTLLNALAEHPKLIERPIVFRGDTAALGRPPEAVLDIL